MMRRSLIIGMVVLVVVPLLTLGLAFPGILVNVQSIGVGSGVLSGPASTGTVCVPYEYYIVLYYYFPIIGWIRLGSATVPNDNITQIYPGNFSADLVAGTNVSAVVYYGGNRVSVGSTFLESTLPAGNYTAVNISPAINSTVALNGEFDLVLKAPQYSISHGELELALQKLSLGTPDGSYTDVRVYVGTLYNGSRRYDVYIDLRCYSLTFDPPQLAAAVGLLWDDGVSHHRTHLAHFSKCRSALESLLARSPYVERVPMIIRMIFKQLEPEIEKKLGEIWNTTYANATVNLTVPFAEDNLTLPFPRGNISRLNSGG